MVVLTGAGKGYDVEPRALARRPESERRGERRGGRAAAAFPAADGALRELCASVGGGRAPPGAGRACTAFILCATTCFTATVAASPPTKSLVIANRASLGARLA